MIIGATFTHSMHLELVISGLEKRGIPRENIGAIPLDKRAADQKVFDTIHRADGISLFDGAAAMAVVFGLLGAIYGFVLTWGPVLWMVIGIIFGGFLGFVLDYSMGKIRAHKNKHQELQQEPVGDDSADVILFINCEINQKEMVEQVFWDNLATGVGILSENGLVNK